MKRLSDSIAFSKDNVLSVRNLSQAPGWSQNFALDRA